MQELEGWRCSQAIENDQQVERSLHLLPAVLPSPISFFKLLHTYIYKKNRGTGHEFDRTSNGAVKIQSPYASRTLETTICCPVHTRTPDETPQQAAAAAALLLIGKKRIKKKSISHSAPKNNNAAQEIRERPSSKKRRNQTRRQKPRERTAALLQESKQASEQAARILPAVSSPYPRGPTELLHLARPWQSREAAWGPAAGVPSRRGVPLSRTPLRTRPPPSSSSSLGCRCRLPTEALFGAATPGPCLGRRCPERERDALCVAKTNEGDEGANGLDGGGGFRVVCSSPSVVFSTTAT